MRFVRWILAATPLALVACSGGSDTTTSAGGGPTSSTGTSTGTDTTSSSATGTGGGGVGPTALVAGDDTTCVVTSKSAVACWGQLANGTMGSSTPALVSGLVAAPPKSDVAPLSLGTATACAITSTGSAVCWGEGSKGQLGNGSTTDAPAPVPVTDLDAGVTAIATGDAHACAVVNGAVKCWGQNNYGQLGDDLAETSSTTPVPVPSLTSGVVAVTSGFWHACALTDAGGLRCWGANGNGALGNDGMNNNEPVPVAVEGLSSGVRAVVAGDFHTCALTTGGAVKCWGNNDRGQVGDGTTNTAYSPVDVIGLSSGVVAITAGTNHTCAVTTGGTVKCWGLNTEGALGSGPAMDAIVSTPVDVPSLSDIVTIAAGAAHTCGVTAGGAVKCWGANDAGQLGDGTNKSSSTPVTAGPLP
ncbi:Outer membrane protein YfgL [Minicystis rosea]|nr:Outer membrane protein YfgL [Minicystis rosea]